MFDCGFAVGSQGHRRAAKGERIRIPRKIAAIKTHVWARVLLPPGALLSIGAPASPLRHLWQRTGLRNWSRLANLGWELVLRVIHSNLPFMNYDATVITFWLHRSVKLDV